MKKLLLFLVLLYFSVLVNSQPVYLISDGGTHSTCYCNFFDSGNSGGNYGANEDFTITFHSTSGTNTHIKMSINNFDVDPSDTLYVFDGSNIAAPLIGAYNNTNNPASTAFQATIYNVSGDLTFRFRSNGVTQASGWFASLSCIPLCQQVWAAVDTLVFDPLPDDSGYVDICHGDTITFAALGSGPGVFPQNGILYTQDAASSLFIWNFGDGTIDTGQVIAHYYSAIHGYDISIQVIDNHGCTNTNFLPLRVRISGNPISTVNPLPNICSKDDTLEITVGYDINNVIQVVPVVSTQASSQSFDSTLFIPDGNLCSVQCYNTDVTFTSFVPGATITSASDILSICVNMEHSYVGDLGFTIYCPNGQNVVLDPNTHSGGAYLGSPMGGASHDAYDSDTYPCDPAYNPSGVGSTYCWSEIYSQQGTMDILSYGTSPVDSTNQITHTNYITSENPLSGLIGCPLNGTWNIQICDDFTIDNGYIFNWTLNLDPSLLPTGWWYDVPIDSFAWGGSYIVGTTDSSIFVYPSTGGTYTYSLTIYDAFGCTYDTTLNIIVVDKPVVNLGNDTSLCDGTILTLDAGNPNADAYLWSTGATSQQIQVNTTGTYIAEVTNTDGGALQCKDSDTIIVTFFPVPVVNLGSDTCIETGIVLDAGFVPNYIYNWSTGATTPTINVSSTGIYFVEVQSGTGSPCFDKDTINIKLIPHPVVDLGPDTTICIQRSVSLTVTQSNETSDFTYVWNNGSINTSSIVFSPNGIPGPHIVSVVKTGCTTATDTVIVTGKLCDVTVPNVFTPNGDGYNDFFVIKGLKDYPNTLVQIFNRWGKKVYESTNYQNDWDGKNQNDGVYFFVITFIDYLEPMTGTVTIFRKN